MFGVRYWIGNEYFEKGGFKTFQEAQMYALIHSNAFRYEVYRIVDKQWILHCTSKGR